jgi:hypothetical protein
MVSFSAVRVKFLSSILNTSRSHPGLVEGGLLQRSESDPREKSSFDVAQDDFSLRHACPELVEGPVLSLSKGLS